MGFFARLWHSIVDFILRTSAHAAESAVQQLDVFSQLEADTLNLVNSIKDLEHFEFNPKWKTRVINVPRAVEGIQEVFDIIFHGFRDKFAVLHGAIVDLRHDLSGKGIGNFPSPEPQSRVTHVVNWLGDFYTGLKAFERAYKAATDIVQTVDDVKRRIETLDDLFLPQGSTKTTVDIRYRKRNA